MLLGAADAPAGALHGRSRLADRRKPGPARSRSGPGSRRSGRQHADRKAEQLVLTSLHPGQEFEADLDSFLIAAGRLWAAGSASTGRRSTRQQSADASRCRPTRSNASATGSRRVPLNPLPPATRRWLEARNLQQVSRRVLFRSQALRRLTCPMSLTRARIPTASR